MRPGKFRMDAWRQTRVVLTDLPRHTLCGLGALVNTSTYTADLAYFE